MSSFFNISEGVRSYGDTTKVHGYIDYLGKHGVLHDLNGRI